MPPSPAGESTAAAATKLRAASIGFLLSRNTGSDGSARVANVLVLELVKKNPQVKKKVGGAAG